MATDDRAGCRRIERHWQVLCHEIGNRYAGSLGEQQAADYIESQFRRLGLTNVEQQPFEFPNWQYSRCSVRVGRRQPTRRIATARPVVYSSSTPPRGVRGRLAYLQTGLPSDFRQSLDGRIGVFIGALELGSKSVQKRVMESGMKALLVVDSRAPYGWITSSGTAPQWAEDYRMPTVGIAYLDAVRLVEQMPQVAQVTVQARSFAATSQNVLGEVVGAHRPDQVIVVSGHHDCVWGNVGADDNGSGVIFVLELARLFATKRVRRTIRFVSYGVEERLSVGAYLYMRSLGPSRLKQVVLALNADNIAGTVGSDEVLVTGTRQLERFVQRVWDRQYHPAIVQLGASPYSDHFPLNIAGVPSVYVGRHSIMNGGHWPLHSEHDNTDHVSSAVLARTINTTADLLRQVANAPRLPVARSIDPLVFRQVRRLARQEYRHPWSPQRFDYDR